MSQQRWLELVKDYDCGIHYHPGKANRMADALSQKEEVVLMCMQSLPKELLREFEELGLELISGTLVNLSIRSTIFEELKNKQAHDLDLAKIMKEIREGKSTPFTLTEDGTLHMDERVCVPSDGESKEQILYEAYHTPYSVHPGSTNMYQDLKTKF